MTDELHLATLGMDLSDNSGCWGPFVTGIYGIAIGLWAQNIVEIGVNKAGSTRALLIAASRTGGHVYSIDIRDCSAAVPQDLKKWWTQIIGDSREVARNWGERPGVPQEIDLLLIDGLHTEDAVRIELEHLGGRVGKGKIVMLDDVNSLPGHDFSGVTKAFEEYGDAQLRYRAGYGHPATKPGGTARQFGIIRK